MIHAGEDGEDFVGEGRQLCVVNLEQLQSRVGDALHGRVVPAAHPYHSHRVNLSDGVAPDPEVLQRVLAGQDVGEGR